MKRVCSCLALCVFTLLTIGIAGTKAVNAEGGEGEERSTATKSVRRKKAVPLNVPERQAFFEENKGQVTTDAVFTSRRKGFTLELSEKAATYRMPDAACLERLTRESGSKAGRKSCSSIALQMKVLGMNPSSQILGEEKVDTKTSYFLGNDFTKWHRNIASFERIRYKDAYSGIDLVFRNAETQELEYDFVVAPGSDPKLVKLEFSGSKRIKIARNGDLIFFFQGLEIRHNRPRAFQIIDGQERDVPARFVSLGENQIGFELGEYDSSKELVIDPTVYASYLGGVFGSDKVNDIAVDRQGFIYTLLDLRIDHSGITLSDVQVTKWSSSGSVPIYTTTLGGAQDDLPLGLDVDSTGKVYITGKTWSPGYPMAFPAQSTHYITELQEDSMAFYTRLWEDGDIMHSTFLGGSCPGSSTWNEGRSIAVDLDDNAYVTGFTCGTNFPVLNAYQTTRQQHATNAFVTKFNDMGHIAYSTYFRAATSIDIDADDYGNVFITGAVGNGGGLPLTPGAYASSGVAYVASFDTNASGASSLRFSTYLHAGRSIAADRHGNVWAANFQGPLLKLNSTGTALLLSVGSVASSTDIAVDGEGSVYHISGGSGSGNSGYLTLSVRRPNGELLDETNFMTGNRPTEVRGIALGPYPGIVYISGFTQSTTLSTTSDAYMPNFPATNLIFGSGFYAKLSLQYEERNPLIFVPGVAGSSLFAANSAGNPTEDLWPGGIASLTGATLRKLSLDPADQGTTPAVVAVDAVRKIELVPYIYDYKVYEPFLNHFGSPNQYVEYDIGFNPKKRNTECTGAFEGERPTLFVFAYDWRKSNHEAAEQLAAFVNCVRLFHPDKKVDIVAHSMGGLVARRYILDHQSDHNVEHLATIASPFLGAPKAINALLTGEFLGKPFMGRDVYFRKKTLKSVMAWAPGAHQLLPSDWYYGLGGHPFAYQPAFSSVTNYSYAEAKKIINARFPARPYDSSAGFHDYASSAQDDWNNDTTGIKYLHLYGVQQGPNTLEKVIASFYFNYPIITGDLAWETEIRKGLGDGTVPERSAKRNAAMLAPNTTIKRCSSAVDNEVDHNGLTEQPFIWNEIHAFLEDTNYTTPKCVADTAPLGESLGSVSTTFVDIHGVERVDITDEFGNTNTPIGFDADKAVAGIGYDPGSMPTDRILDPDRIRFASGKVVDLAFTTTVHTRRVEIKSGNSEEDVASAIKYLDLQVPVGVRALLRFGANGIENLKYDANGDGSFETEVQPTFSLTGTTASDVTKPTINITNVVNGGASTVTIEATDAETGINQIRYAFQGETTDHIYTGPFTPTAGQSGTLYASAEDNAGNRSVLLKSLDTAAPVSSVNQTPPSNTGGWNTSDITFELKSMDEVGGSGVDTFTYSAAGAQAIGEDTLERPLPPFTIPPASTVNDLLSKSMTVFKEGITTFTFSAKDRAGNIEALKTHQVKIDKSLPISSHSLSDNGTQTTFTLTSNDAVSGVAQIFYSIDGGAQQVYNTPFAVSNTGGHVVSYFARDLAGNDETPRSVNINPDSVAKSVLISEFRTRGQLGADDEFIELYNNTDVAIDISGWTLSVKHGSNATPIALASITTGTVLPARGHYLLRKGGTSNYSLAGYAEADQTYTDSLGDNVGIKLVSGPGLTIDAVGFASVTDATYREGTGITPSAGITTNGQYSFARNFVKHLPVDSNNNKTDFVFVATDGGTYNNLKAVLGSPAPENLASQTYREGDVLITQIDPGVTLAEVPNRLYDYTTPPPQYPIGVLSVRRKLTNNTGQTIAQLKVRITAITTKNSPVLFPQQAQLRLFSSSDISVTSGDGQTAIPVKGMTVQTVPSASEGGFNSSLTLDLGSGLASGQSLNIDLKNGIVANGQYKLEFRVEALKAP